MSASPTAMSLADAALLRALADRQAITDQIYRYCRAMDRMDHELGYSIWHEDGTADYGEANFIGSGRGFIDHVNRSHAHLVGHSHQVTNILITLDGDRAGSESYCIATLQMEREGVRRRMQVCSRYVDRWSKRGGVWAIDHRIALMDLAEIAEITAMPLHASGSRDRTDPSYAVLGGA
jgi:hypothetical protein